jgi:DNA-3-methyladenine glycosylase I
MAATDNESRPDSCLWPGNDPLMIAYHDTEWGVPLHEDQKLFEFMLLDAFQAGLSWKTILYRREGFRQAFDGFDPEKIAAFDEEKVLELMQDTRIIRNQSKIRSAIGNAQTFLKVQQEFGSFDKYIWQFTGGKTIVSNLHSLSAIPASTKESDAMSKDLKKRGFKFVGTTICYAFMQAAGMVNDHMVFCYRYKEFLK